MGEPGGKKLITAKPLSECTPSDIFAATQTICLCSLCVPLLGFIISPLLILPVNIKLWWLVVLVYGFSIVWCFVHINLTLASFIMCCVTPLRHKTLGQIFILLKRGYKIYLMGIENEELDEEANVVVDPDEISPEEIEKIKKHDFGEGSGGSEEEMKIEQVPDDQSLDTLAPKIDGFSAEDDDINET